MCDQFGLDREEFSTLFLSAEMKQATQQDFTDARELGVNSFPTILVRTGDKHTVIARGFAESDAMAEAVKKLQAAAR